MAFHIYPDTETAWELSKPDFTPIALAPGEAIALYIPLDAMVGPDLAAGDQPTTFVRIAFNGAAISAGAHPKFQLQAFAPAAALPVSIDPKVSIDPASAVVLNNGSGVAVAAAHFVPPYDGNVYFMKVAIRGPVTTLWIRIDNTTGLRRDLVWVVADNAAEAQQPWLHATLRGSPQVNVDLWAIQGVTAISEPIQIANFGTGPAIITGVAPPIASPVSSTFPSAPINPNQPPVAAHLHFLAPPLPFATEWAAAAFVTGNRVDPGPFGPGHNLSFNYKAQTGVVSTLPAPAPPGLWPLLQVPDVTGKERDEAVALIRAAGFAARILGRSDIKGALLCTEQEPVPGTSQVRGQRVTAYVADPAFFDGQVLHDDALVPAPTLSGRRGTGSRYESGS